MLSRSNAKVISLQPTSSAAAYTSGLQIGQALALTNAVVDSGGVATLTSLTIIDTDKQASAIDVVFFNQKPSTLGTDHAADAFTKADLANVLGVVNIPSASYKTLANGSVASVDLIGLKLQAGVKNVKDLYCVLISRGTPTYTGATSLTLKVGLDQN